MILSIICNIILPFKNVKGTDFSLILGTGEGDILEESPKLKIIENPKFKINKIFCEVGDLYYSTEIICNSFENLLEIQLSFWLVYIKDIKNFFPLFNDKCKVIFKSLISFNFSMELEKKNKYKYNIINNIFNNINCMPNLNQFRLYCNLSITEEVYKKIS